MLIGTTTQGLVIEHINNEFRTYLGHPLSDLVRCAPDLHLVVVPLAPSPYLGFALLPHGRPATHYQRPPASVIDEALPDLSRLSVGERDIVSRLTAGDRAPAIAEALHLSQSTVRNHLSAVFRKLRIHSQTGAH